MPKTLKIACPDCQTTGLYKGFAEAPGEAVVCLGCSGKGWKMFQYEEFQGRKKKPGVSRIRLSRGSLLATGIGGHGEAITYTEFEQRFPES